LATASVVSPRFIDEVVSMVRLITTPTRLTILYLLDNRECNVGQICAELGNPSQPAVSHQLALLRYRKLVEGRREGRNIIYQLTPEGRSVVRAFDALFARHDPQG